MSPKYITPIALLATSAIAAPNPSFMFEAEGADGCGPIGDQPHVANVGFYSDSNCNDRIGGVCISTYQSVIDGGDGHYGCNPGMLPEDAPFYAKTDSSEFDAVQIIFTRDQSCPPNGPGAVFASLIDSSSCVLMNLGGDSPGISIYPNGGSDLAKRSIPELKGPFRRQDGTECDGFNTESEESSYSESVQVSNVVDCINGAESGCEITVGEEQTKSVSTSMELSAGGGIEGIFEISATFGVEYTESSTTSIQQGFSIPAGQKGYLSAYSAATLFKGKFTGCSSGDEEQEGQVLAIKENAFTYSIIYSGSRKARELGDDNMTAVIVHKEENA